MKKIYSLLLLMFICGFCDNLLAFQTITNKNSFENYLSLLSSNRTLIFNDGTNFTFAGQIVNNERKVLNGNNRNLTLRFSNSSEAFSSILNLSNYKFVNFNQIHIEINNIAAINIENCEFSHDSTNAAGQSLRFIYQQNSTTASANSILDINNNFFTVDRRANVSGSFNHIYIYRDYTLENSSFASCDIKMKDISITDNIFTSTISNGTIDSLRVIAIQMYRATNNDYISNLTISNNEFYLNNIEGLINRVQAISLENFQYDYNYSAVNSSSIKNNFNVFDDSKPSYRPTYLAQNQSLTFSNNKFYTKSTNPIDGIFLQGPYKDVRIDSNIVDGFGYFKRYYDNVNLYHHGSIELYGARDKITNNGSGQYSDDFQNVIISNNAIISKSVGIRITGGHSINIYNNHISFYKDPSIFVTDTFPLGFVTPRLGISMSSGGWDINKRLSSNVNIHHNIIDGNNRDSTEGIHTFYNKSLSIHDNVIKNVVGNGIFVQYALNATESFKIDSNIIKNNIIDYSIKLSERKAISVYANNNDHNISTIKGIKVYRTVPSNKLADIRNEVITIKNNIVSAPDEGGTMEDKYHYAQVKLTSLIRDTTTPTNSDPSWNNVYTVDESPLTFTGMWHPGGFYGQNGWYIGDFNGDGKDDIAKSASSNGGLTVLISDGEKRFGVGYNGDWLSSTVSNSGKWYVGDFNGDGKDDIMSQVNANGGARVYLSKTSFPDAFGINSSYLFFA